MAVLDVRNLTKTFGALNAVDDISFKVEKGQILVIVGGSGCGKTTTLRCIAGLEDLSAGSVLLEGKTIASPQFSLPPEERGIGMVFQSYALWPHKTVKQNVAYGLERRKMSAAEAEEKVARILGQVGLTGFENRMPSTLSGGQQQRVALARSAILQPKLLLLDEPLSNLDAKLREQMRDELRQMIKMFNMTAVHITHDQSEAMALADSVICMRAGRIEQEGTPREIYRKPANRYVAEFIGASSFLPGEVVERGARVRVRLDADTTLELLSANMLTADDACVLAIRPEAVTIDKAPVPAANSFQATVESETFLGANTEYRLRIGGLLLRAYSGEDFAVGAQVWVSINPRGITGLEAASRG